MTCTGKNSSNSFIPEPVGIQQWRCFPVRFALSFSSYSSPNRWAVSRGKHNMLGKTFFALRLGIHSSDLFRSLIWRRELVVKLKWESNVQSTFCSFLLVTFYGGAKSPGVFLSASVNEKCNRELQKKKYHFSNTVSSYGMSSTVITKIILLGLAKSVQHPGGVCF